MQTQLSFVHFYITEAQKTEIECIYTNKEHDYLEYTDTLESQATVQAFLSSHQLVEGELAKLESRWTKVRTNSWMAMSSVESPGVCEIRQSSM